MEETIYRKKFQGIFIIWNLDVLLADCLGVPFDALKREGFNKNTIGIKRCDKINMHKEYIEEYVLIFFFF